MPEYNLKKFASYSAFVLFLGAGHCAADDNIESIVNTAIEPVMQQHQIPGVAVAITVNGQAHYFNLSLIHI